MPVAFLIGFTAISLLLQIFGNFGALLPFFVFSAIVIYIFLSNRFLKKVILLNQTMKFGLKDWIKVNGIVSCIASAIMIFVASVVLLQPELLKTTIEMLNESDQLDKSIKIEDLLKSMKIAMIIALVVSILIIAHFFITIKLLKQYTSHFTNDNNMGL